MLGRLKAPYKVGDRWCLEGSIDLSTGDTLTLRYDVSPRSLAWAKGFAARGASLAGRGLRGLAQHVRLDGDWGEFGAFADAVAESLKAAAEDQLLQPPKIFLDLKEIYEAAQGEKGDGEQVRALGILGAASVSAEAGDESAKNALNVMRALGTVDALITGPDGYTELSKLRDMARDGDEAAKMLAFAAKALGSCCCSATNIRVANDAETALFSETSYMDACRFADDVMLLRALGARRHGSAADAMSCMRDLWGRAQFDQRGDGSFQSYGSNPFVEPVGSFGCVGFAPMGACFG